MRNILRFFLAVLLVTRAGAQSNAPVRLALIAESGEASAASDLLTVELSKNPQIKLLERNEIEKVYREQGLSAANRDYLKLGQVLGADGLLLIRANQAASGGLALSSGFAQSAKLKSDLSLQLIAVKPGVLLVSDQFSAPDDLSQWVSDVATYLNPLLPKLSVLAHDAVPISVVNFRSAIQSPETKDLERQITALVIGRMSREHQLFVLERTKMRLLTAEKELRGLNDSAFWNGSYLLDGTIDRDGYSKDKMTISARLVPPKGGTPVPIEVSGSRTNLPGIVNQLAEKVRENLKLSGSPLSWNAADEAQQYFEESRWALKWKLLNEAQDASESAWALGKQDIDCALVRVESYLGELPARVVKYKTLEATFSSGFNAEGKALGPPPSEGEVQADIKAELKNHQFASVYREKRDNSESAATVNFAFADSQPTEGSIDWATHVLELYYNFSRTHVEGRPQPGTEATNWKNSKWSDLGIEVLVAASKVLQDFAFAPESQKPVVSKLAGLRELTWATAEFISQTPSVRDSYYVGSRLATHDELSRTLEEDPNIFSCEVNWGCFWQERPEETLALYRELLSSPAFCYIHNDFWNRDLTKPRLIGWNDEDRKRIPELWDRFESELDHSTNVLWQMEAKALAKTDATTGERARTADADWWTLVRSHRAELIANNVELFHGGWGFADNQETQAMDREYWLKTIPMVKTSSEFQHQKKYLADFTPYDLATFMKLFANLNYSKAQAAELKPLFAAYRSNLVAQATDQNAKFSAKGTADSIKAFYENRLDEVLNAPEPQAVRAAPTSSASPSDTAPPVPPVAKPPPAVKPVIAKPDNATNALVAKRFFAFPTNELPAANITSLIVFGHRMRDDKLLLNLRYGDRRWVHETTDSGREVTVPREAAAIFQSHIGWTMTAFPHDGNSPAGIMDFLEGNMREAAGLGIPLYLEIFENDLYVSDDDAIRRYDVKRKQWQELPFPGQERAQLFAVDKHLYAASPEGIWEILDGGQSAKILASVRRRPAVSRLDSRDNLGKPILFSGKDHSLWAALDGEVLSWDGKDWNPVLKIEDAYRPEIFDGTAFFRVGKTPQSRELWRLSPTEPQPVLCLRESRRPLPGAYNAPQASARRNGPAPEPLWKSSSGDDLVRNPLTIDGEAIYVVSVPLETTRTGTSDAMRNRPRIEPTLVCLMPEFCEPLIIPIRLDSGSGPVTALRGLSGGVPIWIECSSEYLFIGALTLPGVWALPKAEIQAEIRRQLQARPPENRSSQKKETAEDRRKALLVKYDLNHNGQFDPGEKEAAISDPAFLEFEIDKIDANTNGQIDPEELSYFDANNNRTLDAPELAGIRATQHILAVKTLKEFDLDESGRLEQEEYWNFTQNKRTSNAGFRAMQFLPSNSEAERIEHYLEGATEEMLQTTLARMVPGEISHRPANGRLQTDQMLKEEIQRYWAHQNASGISQKPRTEARDSSKESTP